MHGLEKTTDLMFFVGKTLVQVCIGLFQVVLNFDDGIIVSMEGMFEYDGVGGSTMNKSLPQSACLLVELIGKKIGETEILDGGTLVLRFRDAGEVRILDSNRDAESYQIAGPSVDIVV